MKIHHLSCLSYPSLILLCLEVPATYVCGATYVLVISPTTVTIYQQILLYYFVAVFILDMRSMDSQEQ